MKTRALETVKRKSQVGCQKGGGEKDKIESVSFGSLTKAEGRFDEDRESPDVRRGRTQNVL